MASDLLLISVSTFRVAVLLPVVIPLPRGVARPRTVCSPLLVHGFVLLVGARALVLAQAMRGAVRGFSHNLPHIVDQPRPAALGGFSNGGNHSLDTLRSHASEITGGVGTVSAGVAHV